MSAFVVPKAHIDYLVRAGLELSDHRLSWYDPRIKPTWELSGNYQNYMDLMQAARRELRSDNAGEVGRMLWAENHRSVSYRYHETQTTPEYEYVHPYHARRIDPVQVLKAIDCYEYQSCECPDWRSSEAWDFCDSLRSAAIAALPGYDAAEWKITDPARVPA